MKSNISKLYGSKKKPIVESASNVRLKRAVKRKKSGKSEKENKEISLTDLNIRTRKPQNSLPGLVLMLLNERLLGALHLLCSLRAMLNC